MKQILVLTGKARQVFRFLEILATAKGEKTIGQILSGDFDESTALSELNERRAE